MALVAVSIVSQQLRDIGSGYARDLLEVANLLTNRWQESLHILQNICGHCVQSCVLPLA